MMRLTLLCFCISLNAFAKPLLEHIKERKILRACSEAGFMPFEMRDAKGQWTGFDYDMMKAFSDHLGVRLEMLDIKWDSLIPNLQLGKCDMIASSMAITSERLHRVIFSQPVYYDELSFAYLKKSKRGFENLKELDHKDVRVAFKTGSSSDLYILAHPFKEAVRVAFENDIDTINALKNGKVDAVVYNRLYLSAVNKQMNDIFFIKNTGIKEKIGYAFSKSEHSKSLRVSFDEFYTSYKLSLAFKTKYKYYFEDLGWVSKR